MRRTYATLALGVCLLLTAAAPRAMAAHQRLPLQASELTLSPEEAVIAIKPLELTSSDLPAGYSHSTMSVDTPASEAVRQAGAGQDAYAALNQSTSEGTQACSNQAVVPPAGAAVTAVMLSTCLMSDATSAQNVVLGEVRVLNPGTGTATPQTVPAELVLGDGAPTITRINGTDQSGKPTTEYDLRWSRGIVAYEMRARAATGQENTTASTYLAQTVDAGEGTRAAVVLPTATIPAPVTEAQRLYDVLTAQTGVVPGSQPPAPTSSVLSYQVQLPATDVLLSSNPQATLVLLDQTFQRAGFVNEVFRTANKQILHGQRVTVTASAGGAAAELRNRNSDGSFSRLIPGTEMPMPNAQQTDTELTPLLQIGDGARAFMSLVSYPNPANNETTISMRWTHGTVVLQARIGADVQRNLTLADLTPWVQQVESEYQSSSLPGLMRLLAPPQAPLLVSAPLRGQAFPVLAVLPTEERAWKRRGAGAARVTA